MTLFPTISDAISSFKIDSVSEERKQILQPLVAYIQEKVNSDKPVRINFICTHNSRRSHLSQIWMQAMASNFGLKNVICYSGGTESTALFPMVAETLRKTGFQIEKIAEGDNPVYSIKFTDNEHPVIGFSKRLDSDFNPKGEFAAIMTCSQADEGCPFVPGAEKRIPITFEDPKAFDGTPQQAEKYEERSTQIATEMFYVLSQIKK